jgi:hypothetical protein
MPNSWDELALRADLIAHVRVVARVRATGPAGAPATVYECEVLEVFKPWSGPEPHPSTVNVFVMESGDHKAGGYLRSPLEGSPRWHEGNEYLLFLKWNHVLRGWHTAFGVSATLEVGGDRTRRNVHVVGSGSKFVRDQEGRALEIVRAELRKALLKSGRFTTRGIG